MPDLWPENIANKEEVEESAAVELLREQARNIKIKTKGIVSASFSKIEKQVFVEGLETFAKATKHVMGKSSDEDGMKDKKDINKLYNPTAYKFELYNDTYRFRILEIVDRRLFPVEIYCDEDIEEELRITNPCYTESNEEIEERISMILKSKKVRSVIQKMMTDDAKRKTPEA